MVPFRARRMRLERAGPLDARWLARTLADQGWGSASRVVAGADGTLRLTVR